MTDRGKEKDQALRKLHALLIKKLDGQAIKNELYGKGELTWSEMDRIEVAQTKQKANEELLTALRRRGPNVLDVLVECLMEEKEANKDLIEAIRKEWPERPAPTPSVVVPAVQESGKLLGDGSFPFPVAGQPSHPVTIPPPPAEGVDAPTIKTAYKMENKPRGVAIIINNRNFTCGMKDRQGTDKDAESLSKLFPHLGFYTNRYDNLKGKEMHARLDQVAKVDHSKFDCLIIAILTHGIEGKLYSTDGDLIPVEEVTKHFDGNHCPSLIGKPKVFFLQACRGGTFDYGVEYEATDGSEGTPSEAEVKELAEKQSEQIIAKVLAEEEVDGGYTQALPTEADFLLAYATVPGYVSWRNSEYGSWFIKALVDVMHEQAKTEHLMDMLIEVNRRVAEDFQSKGRNKQIPAPSCLLTRKLYFRPGL